MRARRCRPAAGRGRPRRLLRWALGALLLLAAAITTTAVRHVVKPLPAGLAAVGRPVPVAHDRIELLTDVTFRTEAGDTRREQQIFDRMLSMIDGAERGIVLDLFLFNAHLGAAGLPYRRLSEELTAALVAKRAARPEVPILLVTDPINDVYGGAPSPQLERLRKAGVQVVVTALERLRDPNPAWSAPWRVLGQWWGNAADGGRLPHPFASGGPTVSARSWARLLNFKANHRKVALADDGGREWVALVSSANPHDASSSHSNVGVVARHPALAEDLYRAEAAVVRMSGQTPPWPELPRLGADPPPGDATVQLLTETAIRDRALTLVRSAAPGESIDVAAFYLAHRRVIHELAAAAARGVRVRVLLDANEDAFGRSKGGIPNRQTAAALLRRSRGAVELRWAATHGEQFHLKLLRWQGAQASEALIGSANFTRRNLDGFNLEADLAIRVPRGSPFDLALADHLDRLWSNRDGLHTLEGETYLELSPAKGWLAAAQEATGLCSF